MITFPQAKINLGLNIVSRRPDGYHDLETVFYPIPLHDTLEIRTMDQRFPSDTACDLKVTGDAIACNEDDNLVVRAYRLLAADYVIPRVHAHLYKQIPSQAGLGGGSSDAAYMIRLIDERYRLNLGNAEMECYAARLGADCAFFISAEPAFATGIGDQLSPVNITCLHGLHLVVVKPDIAVSTREAYSMVQPRLPKKSCRDIVSQPIETWASQLANDFEPSVFAQHPELARIKEQLYRQGAIYAQMSGSGSALYGIYNTEPHDMEKAFPNCRVFTMTL